MTEFGDKLRFLRLHRNLRQKELAARTGLRASTISDLEAGKSSPRQRTRALLARALGMSLDEFDAAMVTITSESATRNGQPAPRRSLDVLALLERVASGNESATSLRQAIAEQTAILWTTDLELRVTSGWRSSTTGPAAGETTDVRGASIARWFGKAIGAAISDPMMAHAHAWVLRGESVTFTTTVRGRRWTTHLRPRLGPDGRVAGVIGLALSSTTAARPRQVMPSPARSGAALVASM
ncbi:MAG: helix-turn-helix domain-containing protein [Planctomycetota bacterium]|jgi:transcriptional regulator with XRE-family HTH domain